MTERTSRVLVVANRTAATPQLLGEVRRRAAVGPVEFHLLVPATPHGLHRVVDPEVAGHRDAEQQLEVALGLMRTAAGARVAGHVGDADPLAAISDAMHFQRFDEIIVSTLSHRLSRWMRIDLPSKVRGLGLAVTHVSPDGSPVQLEAPIRRAA